MASDATTQPSDAMSRGRFVGIASMTIALTLFLISVGAFVRVSGAGLGCPDWPKCFGLWIPPTTAADLPAGYDARLFNVTHTWTEYLNRLLGALVGISILATLMSSVRNHRARPRVIVASAVAFVGVLVAAWLGKNVVEYRLAPWMVTAHLLSAIVVVSALVVAIVDATTPARVAPSSQAPVLFGLSVATYLASVVQGAIGTQVRGQLQTLLATRPELPRGALIDLVGTIDIVHRNFALAVAACAVALSLIAVTQFREVPSIRRLGITMGALPIAQIIVGLALAYAGLPPAMQILHLVIGTAMTVVAMALAMLAWQRRPSLSSSSTV